MALLRFFDRNKRDFYLENVIDLNREFLRTFLIPLKSEIDKLEIDNLVKLVFVMEKAQKKGCRAERMWVKIKDLQNGVFAGILDSEPYYIKTIKCGDTVSFKTENIAAIYGGKSQFNEKLFAIITKRHLKTGKLTG